MFGAETGPNAISRRGLKVNVVNSCGSGGNCAPLEHKFG